MTKEELAERLGNKVGVKTPNKTISRLMATDRSEGSVHEPSLTGK